MNRNTSQERKKATLNNTNDDDFEPVRPMMETNDNDMTDISYYEETSTINRKNNKTISSNVRIGYEK